MRSMRLLHYLEVLWQLETTGIPCAHFILYIRGHLVQLSHVTGKNAKAQKSQVTLSTSING